VCELDILIARTLASRRTRKESRKKSCCGRVDDPVRQMPGPRFEVTRGCAVCPCDRRDGQTGAGYIIATTSDGLGAPVWIEDEEVFVRLKTAFAEMSEPFIADA